MCTNCDKKKKKKRGDYVYLTTFFQTYQRLSLSKANKIIYSYVL